MAFDFFKKIFKLHKIYGPNAYFVALCFGLLAIATFLLFSTNTEDS